MAAKVEEGDLPLETQPELSSETDVQVTQFASESEVGSSDLNLERLLTRIRK